MAAAGQILSTEGRDALTQLRVAEVSGVSRATVYRFWSDRSVLVLDALGHLVELGHTTPSGDDLEGDLSTEIFSLARQIDGDLRLVIATLIEQSQHDTAVAEVLDRLEREGTRVVRALLEAGISEGTVRADVPLEVTLSQLLGSVTYQLLIRRQAVDLVFARHLAHSVLASPSGGR